MISDVLDTLQAGFKIEIFGTSVKQAGSLVNILGRYIDY